MSELDDVLTIMRKAAVEDINSHPKEREELEKLFGQVWDTQELQRDFEVTGFLAPFVGVIRKSDRVEGALLFQHLPRYYWGFEPKESHEG